MSCLSSSLPAFIFFSVALIILHGTDAVLYFIFDVILHGIYTVLSLVFNVVFCLLSFLSSLKCPIIK
jgi:hypothetical protein